MTGCRRSTYGLFDDDDDEEEDEGDNRSTEDIQELPIGMEGLIDVPRRPPGAWPIESPIYEEPIYEEPITPPPFFSGALSPLHSDQVEEIEEIRIASPKPPTVDNRTEEGLSKLKADVIKLQLNRKRMKARLGALEKQSSKIARLDDTSDQLRNDQQQYQQGIDVELDAIRGRLHLLEERMSETDYNAAVDGLSSRNLGAEVRNVVGEDPDPMAIDRTREEIATTRDAVQSLLSELTSAQKAAEAQLQRLELTASETRKRERDAEEEVDTIRISPPAKRARTVGEFALATAVGAAMVWTGLALY